MVEITLDGKTIPSRQAFHRQIAQLLHFPAYYGANLDALYDCLTDIGEDTCLHLYNTDALSAQLGSYGAKLQLALRDAAAANPYFTVLLTAGDVEA